MTKVVLWCWWRFSEWLQSIFCTRNALAEDQEGLEEIANKVMGASVNSTITITNLLSASVTTNISINNFSFEKQKDQYDKQHSATSLQHPSSTTASLAMYEILHQIFNFCVKETYRSFPDSFYLEFKLCWQKPNLQEVIKQLESLTVEGEDECNQH